MEGVQIVRIQLVREKTLEYAVEPFMRNAYNRIDLSWPGISGKPIIEKCRAFCPYANYYEKSLMQGKDDYLIPKSHVETLFEAISEEVKQQVRRYFTCKSC